MSFMRSTSTTRLVRASQSTVRPLRCFSTTCTRVLREPDPRAIPDAQAMQATEDQASMIEAEHKPESHLETYHPRNQPEYDAHTDQGTSTYSPVPRRLLDGSEDRNTTPAAILSGAPVDLQARTVRIYKPTKPATQSGNWGGHNWRMDWDPLSRGHRWENPLMGWQSSADWMQGTKLNFRSKEEAITFAEKQGYEYYVQEPNKRKFVPKAYANNFLHEAGPLKHIKTK